MKQQTAVEWLITQVNSEQYQIAFGQTYISIDLIEQAKQIEKEQIINAFDIACEDKDRIGKEYYYDTYGGQGSPDTITSPNTHTEK